ncbi:hypothetical protein ACWGH3_17370 [Streptomyces sp. NPDC054884]|uniref:hypothetical protein n=1 Tax=Streptomyces sp. ME08-AFT2 TaxID=3028683 RepID=UPI0029B06D9D|nr:hypothetical protein [Streptomyces sp. ME08-AFT2]MDX3309672.1 hypothetical protein [Streptomyces sp. ME08-AFT2]
MSSVGWEEVKRRVHEQQRAAGIPVMTPEEKQEAKDRLLAEVRAYKLAELRREQDLTQRDIADSMGVSAPPDLGHRARRDRSDGGRHPALLCAGPGR